MEYKDAVGLEIKAGDHIVYSASDGALQLGRVIELRTIDDFDYVYDKKTGYYKLDAKGKPIKKITNQRPSLKIQGARRSWDEPDKFEKMKPSIISKFENVLVLSNNLVAQLTLM
jgi:hypothetical protein